MREYCQSGIITLFLLNQAAICAKLRAPVPGCDESRVFLLEADEPVENFTQWTN